MRYLILLFVNLACLLFGCDPKSQSERASTDSLSRDRVIIPLKYKTLFKLGNQSEFAFTYDDIERLLLIKVDSLQLLELLQGDELLQYNSDNYSHYFYSYQSPHRRFQAITLLINTDFNFTVYYLTYSIEGKLISKFAVAGSGGDGLFLSESKGYFTNDSTYVYELVSKEFSDDEGTVKKIDSIKDQIVITPSGHAKQSRF